MSIYGIIISRNIQRWVFFFGKESPGKLLHFDPKSNPEIGDDMRPDLTNLTLESGKKRRKLEAARMTHVQSRHYLLLLFELKKTLPRKWAQYA